MFFINNYIYLVGSLFAWIRACLIRSSSLNPISFNKLINSLSGVAAVVWARNGTLVFWVGIDKDGGFLVTISGEIYFLKKFLIDFGKRHFFNPNTFDSYNIPDMRPIMNEGSVFTDSDK